MLDYKNVTQIYRVNKKTMPHVTSQQIAKFDEIMSTKATLTIVVEGYENDEDLWHIPEVRQWCDSVLTGWPLILKNLSDETYKVFELCTNEITEITESGSYIIQTKADSPFIRACIASDIDPRER